MLRPCRYVASVGQVLQNSLVTLTYMYYKQRIMALVFMALLYSQN